MSPTVSISPLLKELVRDKSADPKEIDAAHALLAAGSLSEAQRSLFLGLLRIRGQHLGDRGAEILSQIISPSPALGKTATNAESASVASTLERLLERDKVEAVELADAVNMSFKGTLPDAQCALLLGLLAYTGLDREPEVLAETAERMRRAGARVDLHALRSVTRAADRASGSYRGNFCDIVGTGGDGHSTFNVSTTASIIASSYLLLAKHGNRASSSTSGSADLLQAIKPRGPLIEAITATNLPSIYHKSNYAFLFAPIFHPGMKHVAVLRKELGIRTIFNVLGPLANPVHEEIEARVVGVAERSMGPVFAECLRLSGAKNALVVCGAENLDEISCAGKTYCWRVLEAGGIIDIQQLEISPADFGLPAHPLAEVAGGRLPHENAEILKDLLENKLEKNDPVLDFVLLNAAALLVLAGLHDTQHHGEAEETGPGGLRWKEGVRLARRAIDSGQALESLDKFIDATHSLDNA